MSQKQQTLNGPVSFQGKGLHTGLNVKMTFLPAEAGSGIRFRRTDMEGAPEVEALADYVVDTARGTTIERKGVRVSTIEHVMAALWSCGVDNAIVEVDAPETPIMDGSAREYAEAIERIGLKEQDADRVYYEINEKTVFSIEDKDVEIAAYPDDKFVVATLVTGRVKFHCQQKGREVTYSMQPGQKVIYNLLDEKLLCTTTFVESDIAWKSGRIIYRDTPLEDALRTLSKRFDVEFRIVNPLLKKYCFTGTFINQRLDKILEHFNIASGVRYRYLESALDNGVVKEKTIIEIF